MNRTKISIIVTTYNAPEKLDRVISSLLHQSFKDFDVIIADDGSGQETREKIAQFQQETDLDLKHFWQKDDGFRPGQARNGAAMLADGEYLVFTDGDCCLFPDFVQKHLELSEQGYFLTGHRCFVRKWMTERILRNGYEFYLWPKIVWFTIGLLGQVNRPFLLLDLPISDASRKKKTTDWEKAQSCNLGVWKSDMVAIGGFDEIYRGHGFEDSDFILRLIRYGIKRKIGIYTSPVLHLHHEKRKAPGKKYENLAQFDRLLESDRYVPIRRMPTE